VCEAKGQTFPARGSDRAAGQRPRAQRSLTVKSIFVTFDASKVMGLCGQEQTDAY